MSVPAPASADSICALGHKVGDARADLLVGQGQILKNAGDNTSAILRDANSNALLTNANIDRTGFAGINETVRSTDKLGLQANTIAWNEMNLQDSGFNAVRAQNERINDAQSAFGDRASKHLSQSLADSFSRLSAQGENGFARELDATTQGIRQTVHSEMGLTRGLNDGFMVSAAAAAANYANLSQQNALTNNRTGDHIANVLGVISRQHADMSRDLVMVNKEIISQAAVNAAASQLEAAKNASALQLQAAINSKDAVLQASVIAKDSLLEQSKWFAQAEKTAMINKCEIEAKLAACCCEIKETVVGTANATQNLVQSNEAARIRDALAAAVAENSVLRSRREERPVPYPFPYPYHHHHRSESPRRDRQ